MTSRRHDTGARTTRIGPGSIATASAAQATAPSLRCDSSTFACLATICAVLLWAYAGAQQSLAIAALSFWHYYLYRHAFRYGAVPLPVFKRDAVLMKTTALLALAVAYLPCRPSAVSLAVVAAGFLLNAVAAHALGSDRTYYGHEVAGLPVRRVAGFPYSWTAHPMLLGNVVAYAGTMLDAGFRAQWWPLACAHIALNLGLLWMEVAVTPLRLGSRSGATAEGTGGRPRTACGATLVASAGMLAAGTGWQFGTSGAQVIADAALGACITACALVVHRAYSAPTLAHRSNSRPSTEEAS